MKHSSNTGEEERWKRLAAKAKKIRGSGKDYGKLTAAALNRALTKKKSR